MITEIKCPHCGYGGDDAKIGSRPVGIDILGIPRILCSACGRYFIITKLNQEEKNGE